MKPGSRMRGYLAVIAVLVLALLLRPGSEAASDADGIVQAVERRHAPQHLPRIHARTPATPPALFASVRPAQEPVPELPPPEPALAPLAQQAPELVMLGWMRSGATRHVFVEWRQENHALAPSATLDDTYRFEGIDQGMAEFTYLPDGTTRMFRVGDLDTAE